MIARFARWVLRRELRRRDAEEERLKLLLGQWREWALVQERYRREVLDQVPGTARDVAFREWFFAHSEKKKIP